MAEVDRSLVRQVQDLPVPDCARQPAPSGQGAFGGCRKIARPSPPAGSWRREFSLSCSPCQPRNRPRHGEMSRVGSRPCPTQSPPTPAEPHSPNSRQLRAQHRRRVASAFPRLPPEGLGWLGCPRPPSPRPLAPATGFRLPRPRNFRPRPRAWQDAIRGRAQGGRSRQRARQRSGRIAA